MFQSCDLETTDVPSRCSEGDVVPSDGVVGEGIKVDGIGEFTILVLDKELGLGVLADIDEVFHVEEIGEVHVEVILGMLDGVHPFLNESVSPDSGEGESLIVKLPGVDSDVRVETLMLSHLVIDKHSGIVVLLIEGSGEQIDFLIELLLGNINSGLTRSGELLLNNGAVSYGSKASEKGSHYR